MASKDLSLGAKEIARRMLWRAAQVPVVRPALIAYYGHKTSDNNWDREHPYDRAHGVRTSGMLPGFLLRPGEPMDVPTTIYSAAQPSIIRQALRHNTRSATLPFPGPWMWQGSAPSCRHRISLCRDYRRRTFSDTLSHRASQCGCLFARLP
jgi:hypothetical protein